MASNPSVFLNRAGRLAESLGTARQSERIRTRVPARCTALVRNRFQVGRRFAASKDAVSKEFRVAGPLTRRTIRKC